MDFKKIIWVLYIILNSLQIYPAEIKYKVADIPPELLANAKAVIREDNVEFKILSASEAKIKTTHAITILNNNGIDDSRFICLYDKFIRVNYITATLYNEKGEKVKKDILANMEDYSAISGYSLYEDSRMKYIDPEYRDVPFTVEYTYEIKYSQMVAYPDWFPYNGYNISVEKSKFSVVVPFPSKLRYYEKNIQTPHTEELIKAEKKYTWEISNLKAVNEEPYSLSFREYLPTVYFAPGYFIMDNYPGDFGTWKGLGLWIKELNKGRNNLSDETRKHILTLVENANDDVEKIRILYEYLQNKTRYVSIQIGIGGLQPIDAATVDKVSYGDCKALTNYMKTLLDVAGITSYYTEILAGRDAPPLIKEFPSNQFNHVFLCVPVKNDTIWLECTSQYGPFGYLGTLTDDRDALLITDTAGVLVHTRVYSQEENKKQCKAVVAINHDLTAQASVNTKYEGLFYDEIKPVIHSDDADKKKLILSSLDIANFELTGFSHNEHKSALPYVNQELSLNLYNYCTALNNRVILPLNLLNKTKENPVNTGERKSDIYIRRASTTIDTVIYKIPEGYTVEKIPENITLESPYGKYTVESLVDKQQIIYIRTLLTNKGTYPLSGYEDFVAFFEKIQTYDNVKCLLKRL